MFDRLKIELDFNVQTTEKYAGTLMLESLFRGWIKLTK